MKKAITITNSKIIINKKVFERMCLLETVKSFV